MAPKGMLSYTVSYDSANHWGVMTQMWGSLWPQVLPYCIFNVIFMLFLTYVDNAKGINLQVEISTTGHNFITLVVSFLLVSRITTGLARYNQARDCLNQMYKETRQLVQEACVFSIDNSSKQAKEWRSEVSYRTLLLLRTAMAVIDYPTTGLPAWSVPELAVAERNEILKSLFTKPELRRYAHSERTQWEECMRVPIRMAYLLQKSIREQSDRGVGIPSGQESKMLGTVQAFMSGYYGMRKFLTTPIPFPHIQMARTFLFLYVFTIPFVLLRDTSCLLSHCFSVFLITYGFMGMEITAIELDNPFGDDPNDFNNLAMAGTAFEDTYLTVLDVDGQEWADKLREEMHDQETKYDPGNLSERTWLLDGKSTGIV